MNSRNLVVLALLAVLAVALVSAIGCVEQQTAVPDQEAPIQIIEDISRVSF